MKFHLPKKLSLAKILDLKELKKKTNKTNAKSTIYHTSCYSDASPASTCRFCIGYFIPPIQNYI